MEVLSSDEFRLGRFRQQYYPMGASSCHPDSLVRSCDHPRTGFHIAGRRMT